MVLIDYKFNHNKSTPKSLFDSFEKPTFKFSVTGFHVYKPSSISRPLISGFVPFFEQKNSRTFQGHISHFSRTPFIVKKGLESMSFLVLP